MFSLNAFCTARNIEFFYAFVLEGLDRWVSVACCATQSIRIMPRISGQSARVADTLFRLYAGLCQANLKIQI